MFDFTGQRFFLEEESFRQTGEAPRAKSKVIKKAAKKKTAESSDPPEDVDESDPEVELDSLGSFFIHLIDNDYFQDDAEASRADHVEVIYLSSDSDHVSVHKLRHAVRKVKYSHPLAHLDPQFSLKTQQTEGRRTTRHSASKSLLPVYRIHHPGSVVQRFLVLPKKLSVGGLLPIST